MSYKPLHPDNVVIHNGEIVGSARTPSLALAMARAVADAERTIAEERRALAAEHVEPIPLETDKAGNRISASVPNAKRAILERFISRGLHLGVNNFSTYQGDVGAMWMQEYITTDDFQPPVEVIKQAVNELINQYKETP